MEVGSHSQKLGCPCTKTVGVRSNAWDIDVEITQEAIPGNGNRLCTGMSSLL